MVKAEIFIKRKMEFGFFYVYMFCRSDEYEQLIILELMNRRGMIKDKGLLHRFKDGYEGELEFIQWFRKYNKSR